MSSRTQPPESHHPGTDRRRFLLISLAAGFVAPLAVEAQQPGKVWRIGVLSFTSFPGEAGRRIEAFKRGLGELGYVERRNVAIESRSSDGKDERLPALAAELVRSRVDVIATYGTRSTQAAQHNPALAAGAGGSSD